MADAGIRIEGLETLVAGMKTFEAEALLALKAELKKAGDLVRAEAEQRFDSVDPKSAMGYRVYLRAAGTRVDVEQSLSRVTGQHPEYGALQMRVALIPSLNDKQDQLFSAAEAAITAIGEKI